MVFRPQIESLIQAYLDDELSPSEKALFERERSVSLELNQKIEQARAVSAQMFEALGTQRLSHDLTSGVMGHLPELDGNGEYQRQEFAREATWRVKHPSSSRASWVLTVMSALAPVILAVLGFAIFQAWPGGVEAPKVVGMVTAVSGESDVHDSEGLLTRDASLLSMLHAGDAVETNAESGVVLSLSGPTVVKVPASSRVKVIGPRAVQLEKGRAWLNVAKHSERFRVRTSLGDITVFGTIFSVDVQADRVTVVLEEGEVTVENGEDFQVLQPGEQAVMQSGAVLIAKTAVDAKSLHAWADTMQPDAAAEVEFARTLGPLDGSLLRAEQVWWVDTQSKGGLAAMSFTWDMAYAGLSPMAYDVLVYNETMQPLFSRRIDAGILNSATARQVELQIPAEESFGGTTFVRLVPDESTGKTEVLFKEVSLIGAPAPEVQ